MKKNQKKKKKSNFSFKEKLLLGTFMTIVPKLISIWQENNSQVGFDEYLLSIIDNYKNQKGGNT